MAIALNSGQLDELFKHATPEDRKRMGCLLNKEKPTPDENRELLIYLFQQVKELKDEGEKKVGRQGRH